MSEMLATYVANGVQDSERYDSNTPHNVDVELPIILKQKYFRYGLPDDFQILSVYDVEMDELIEFD